MSPKWESILFSKDAKVALYPEAEPEVEHSSEFQGIIYDKNQPSTNTTIVYVDPHHRYPVTTPSNDKDRIESPRTSPSHSQEATFNPSVYSTNKDETADSISHKCSFVHYPVSCACKSMTAMIDCLTQSPVSPTRPASIFLRILLFCRWLYLLHRDNATSFSNLLLVPLHVSHAAVDDRL